MNEIKVTVTYKKPTTTKFDALMAEYEAAKQLADETVAYYKPLADAAEEAKFNAIMEQLETIKRYAKQICDLDNNKKEASVSAYLDYTTRNSQSYGSLKFEVLYHVSGQFYVSWDGDAFTMNKINSFRHLYCEGSRNIIGKWDQWQVYERLEESACKQLKALIERQAARGQKQIDRLNNIIK